MLSLLLCFWGRGGGGHVVCVCFVGCGVSVLMLESWFPTHQPCECGGFVFDHNGTWILDTVFACKWLGGSLYGGCLCYCFCIYHCILWFRVPRLRALRFMPLGFASRGFVSLGFCYFVSLRRPSFSCHIGRPITSWLWTPRGTVLSLWRHLNT